MTAKFFALLTNIGAAKLANATALGTRLEITHMAVGDGGGTLPTPNPAQTQLVNEQRRAALNMLTVDPVNTSQIIAEQVIPETEGGWWIREIGLLDKDGDLIAIANCAETYKPQLQEGSGRTQTIRVILIVSSTAAVTLKIDPSVVLATRKYVDDRVIEVKAYADDLLAEHVKSRNHPDASKTEKGFVKLSSATTSDSEVLAATPKAVKTVADAATKAVDDHGKAENPHSQYLQMSQLTGVVGAACNARMSVTAASATATFTADELIVQTAIGGEQYKLANFNNVINLAKSGAGGMNTGAVPAAGFVALYAIYNPINNASALLAINATSAAMPEICAGAMPANYTASALVSVWRVDGSKFVAGFLRDRVFSGIQTNALTSTAMVGAVTALSVTSLVSLNAKSVTAIVSMSSGGASGNLSSSLYASSGRLGRNASNGTSTNLVSTLVAEISTPGVIYYECGSNLSTSSVTIDIVGYTF